MSDNFLVAVISLILMIEYFSKKKNYNFATEIYE